MGIISSNITMKKRTWEELMTYYILVMPFLLAFFLEFAGLPGFVKYTIDAAWVLLIGRLLLKKRLVIQKNLLPYLFGIGISVLYMLIVYLFRYQSLFYFLWGFRNNYRFYFAFLLFVLYIKAEDAWNCLEFMDVMFWINGAVSLIQFFVLGYEQDYLGGIFGVERGCNAYSILFFSIVITKSVLSYMNKEEKLVQTILKCGMALLIAALAEIKIFFVFFVIILVAAAFVTGFSKRKVVLFLAAFILFFYAGNILVGIFGEGSSIHPERVIELVTAKNYATAEDLGRFTAIPSIAKKFLTSWTERFVGMGMGNCDVSAFPICSTPFYKTYAKLHYTWFSSAFLFLETGIIGLFLYLIFFVSCFYYALKQYKEGEKDPLFCQMAIILSGICMILTFYNSSLRMEVAYMAYFILALPFLKERRSREKGYRRVNTQISKRFSD